MSKRLLTVTELAKELDVQPSTIERWYRTGLIPVVTPTTRIVRFDLDDVVAALKRRSRETQAKARKG